jgi:tyrosine-specific transport protein
MAVPFGKIPLASLYKASFTLIVEQGAEKLGVFDFLGNLLSHAAAS